MFRDPPNLQILDMDHTRPHLPIGRVGERAGLIEHFFGQRVVIEQDHTLIRAPARPRIHPVTLRRADNDPVAPFSLRPRAANDHHTVTRLQTELSHR